MITALIWLMATGVGLATVGLTRWVVDRAARRALARITAVALDDCPPELHPEIHVALTDLGAGLGMRRPLTRIDPQPNRSNRRTQP